MYTSARRNETSHAATNTIFSFPPDNLQSPKLNSPSQAHPLTVLDRIQLRMDDNPARPQHRCHGRGVLPQPTFLEGQGEGSVCPGFQRGDSEEQGG